MMVITLTMAVLVAKMVTATIMVVVVVETLTVVVVMVRIGRWGRAPRREPRGTRVPPLRPGSFVAFRVSGRSGHSHCC